MGMLCAVTFTRYGRLYYADPGAHSPAVGDWVLVSTSDGPEVAQCVWAAQWVSEETSGFPVLAGMATADDLSRDKVLRRKKAQGKVAAKRLIRAHDLPMKVVSVDHVLDANRTTIYFTAPQRVDFRALVRDLGATLSARVELRQLNARDAAKAQGGVGPCGRDLCCSTFLTDFEPVTVRMAREQDLPLNPMRISGACGRLMCCLKYEHPLYQAFDSTTPAVGSRVVSPSGPGRVVGRSVPTDSVTVRLDSDGSRCVCDRADVCGSRQAYEGSPASDGPVGG